MIEQRIDPVLVEKVEARWDLMRAAASSPEHGHEYSPDVWAEAAIRCVFDELELKEEHSSTWRRNRDGSRQVRARLVSDWRLVEQGDAK